MLKRGEIVSIRRGLYIKSRDYGGMVEPIDIANQIYGPSYISLEYALSYYGLIPERVETISSVTVKRSSRFSTPLGTFSYEHIPARAYPAGIDIIQSRRSGVLFATREKALCDRLALASTIRSVRDIVAFIDENLRIDMDDLSGLSINLLREIDRAYGLHRIGLFVSWYVKKYGQGARES